VEPAIGPDRIGRLRALREKIQEATATSETAGKSVTMATRLPEGKAFEDMFELALSLLSSPRKLLWDSGEYQLRRIVLRLERIAFDLNRLT
jgi:hypothetical protein